MGDSKEFGAICALSIDDQAIYFLNAFWKEHGEEAEKVWKLSHDFHHWDTENQVAEKKIEQGQKKTQDGTLDEVFARKLLEASGKTMTAIAFRNEFKNIDVNFDKHMSFTELLLYEFKESADELCKRPQITSEEYEAAKSAKRDVDAEIAKIENHRQALQAKADEGGVKGNAAKNELAQLDAQDHMDLNKAIAKVEENLRKAKKTVGEAPAGPWWIERQMQEAQKYKPKKH